jgi:hypothetical protein
MFGKTLVMELEQFNYLKLMSLFLLAEAAAVGLTLMLPAAVAVVVIFMKPILHYKQQQHIQLLLEQVALVELVRLKVLMVETLYYREQA